MNLNHLVNKNQSIKIVPSVEESLRSIGLNVDLDDDIKVWFEQLKISWKTWKKSVALGNHIEALLNTVTDPYRVILVFIIKCEDSKDCKPKTLPFFLIEILQKWSQTSQVLPQESLKLPAFQIGTLQRNQHFLSLIVKTYQIYTVKDVIVPMVKDMVKNDNCKQASQVVIAMELFDDITVQDLLFPLILQDKANMIDEYLSECPSQVKPFLLFLDTLLEKNFNMTDYVQSYIQENQITNVKYRIHKKPLGKLVARLCNKFNIPIETCKNLSRNRTTGGLRYLIHQKYIENNVSSSVWEDLIKDSLRQNADSAQEFIDMLIDHDRQEALKWAKYLQIPENDLPLALQDLSLKDEQEEIWDSADSTQEYYKLSISKDNIIVIDSGEKFYDLTELLSKCSIVSIDCEWKPSFGATQSQVALIQVATTEKVYLIDTMILNHKSYNSFWYAFHKSFLDNAEIIKLGFGLEQDLRELKGSVTGLNNIKVKGEGLLDIGILWKNLISAGLVIPGNSDVNGNSLSSLVQSCFGLPLEKSEQCSNWEIRPLRITQIEYAALDAHILIELYHFLEKLCKEQKINFEDLCNDVMLEKKKKVAKRTKVADRITASINPIEPKSAKDIKFFVEPTLSHITSYLRYCGIDTTIIPSTLLWHDIINIAISEERRILLTKAKYTPTVNYSQSSILDVGLGSIRDQVHKVLKYFELNISQSDLFSRCISCNSIDIKKLTHSDVAKIYSNNETIASSTVNHRYHSNFDDDEDDEYNNFLSDEEDQDLFEPVAAVPQKKIVVTDKGVTIETDDAYSLLATQKPALLCESCGKLYWENDKLYKSVNVVCNALTNLAMNW